LAMGSNSKRDSLVDYHVHSTFSSDAESTIIEQCRRAVKLGLREIGFVEHVDFEPADEGTGFLDWEEYSKGIEEARRQFEGLLTVRKGLEMCFQPCLAGAVTSYFEGRTNDADYLMGSVHWVEHKRVNPDLFHGLSEEEAYSIYFNRVLQLVDSGHFDVLGHLDLVKRHGTRFYGPFRFERYRKQIGEVLALAIEKRVAVEVNTSGFRQDPGEPYPGFQTIKLYRELGGELITVGSDSHSTASLARGIPLALGMLRKVGFRSITIFEKRRPAQIPIL
jgi:histidinol-phosphatase (PHP family)